jgi:hypothetical protein
VGELWHDGLLISEDEVDGGAHVYVVGQGRRHHEAQHMATGQINKAHMVTGGIFVKQNKNSDDDNGGNDNDNDCKGNDDNKMKMKQQQ